jgi:hypothetical protein
MTKEKHMKSSGNRDGRGWSTLDELRQLLVESGRQRGQNRPPELIERMVVEVLWALIEQLGTEIAYKNIAIRRLSITLAHATGADEKEVRGVITDWLDQYLARKDQPAPMLQ